VTTLDKTSSKGEKEAPQAAPDVVSNSVRQVKKIRLVDSAHDGGSAEAFVILEGNPFGMKRPAVIADRQIDQFGVIWRPDNSRNGDGERTTFESLTVGIVEFAHRAVEDGFGQAQFSKEKAERIRTWDRLTKAFESKKTIVGIITGKANDGFMVDIGNVRAFLPGSLVDVRPVRDTAYLEGKPLEFKVIKLDRLRNNVVVSRREVLEAEYSAERDMLLEKLQEGAILKGVVKNLVEYGAFVDLGGIYGLLHITDMTWKRIKDPAEVVTVGQEIEVKVLKYDRERRHVSLGLKQLGADPWVDIERRYPEKTRLFGKVTNITDYGAFVEIEPGVEGLVHVSEMDWTNKNVNPSKLVHLGDEVEVMILDIDEERRRISLGLTQYISNAAWVGWYEGIIERSRSIDREVFIRSASEVEVCLKISELLRDANCCSLAPEATGDNLDHLMVIIRKWRLWLMRGDAVESILASQGASEDSPAR